MLEIAICDDDRKELETVSDMVQEICGELKRECNIHPCRTPDEILSGHQRIHIAILDIVMPQCNGIDLGRKLKEKYPGIELIYTTSFADYCRQAVNEVHAFSYLVKPIERQVLKKQIADCMEILPKKNRKKKIVFENIRNGAGEVLKSVSLDMNDILYCEYVKTKREVSIILADEVYYYRETFENFSKMLEGCGFAVNSRGSTVNLRHIKSMKGYSIYLDNGEELQLAQKRVAEFKEQINRYIHGS